jgi:hypothetical protein
MVLLRHMRKLMVLLDGGECFQAVSLSEHISFNLDPLQGTCNLLVCIEVCVSKSDRQPM